MYSTVGDYRWFWWYHNRGATKHLGIWIPLQYKFFSITIIPIIEISNLFCDTISNLKIPKYVHHKTS